MYGQKPKVVCLNKCFIKRIVLPHVSSLIPGKKNYNSSFFTSVSIKFTLDIFTHCFPFLCDILFLNLHNEIEKNLDALFKDFYFKLLMCLNFCILAFFLSHFYLFNHQYGEMTLLVSTIQTQSTPYNM